MVITVDNYEPALPEGKRIAMNHCENYPTIPILPRQHLNGMPTLFVSFNSAGCEHYDYVYMEDVQSEPEKQQRRETNERKLPEVSCSCGVSKKCQGSLSNIGTTSLAHTPAGPSVLRLELLAEETVHAEDFQIHLGNVKLGMLRWSVHHERRQMFDIQKSIKLNSQAYLDEKGEPLREGALTNEEFFVVEELIKLFHESSEKLSVTSLLDYYNFIQSRDASIMTVLFKKQVELCYSKT